MNREIAYETPFSNAAVRSFWICRNADRRHLEILEERTPQEFRGRLTLMPEKFPDELHIQFETIADAFTAAGFTIDTAEIFSQDEYPEDVKLDGREGVGCIATKEK